MSSTRARGARSLMLLFGFMLLLPPSLRAGESLPPIIALHRGNLYAIQSDGEVRQLTERGVTNPEGHPLEQRDIYLSPDGRHLVYRVTPDFFVQAMNANLVGNLGETPGDLVLVDIEAGNATPIVAHEPGAQWDERDTLIYVLRRDAAWSPDSTQFAYIRQQGGWEYSRPGTQLVVYDVSTAQSRVLVEGNEWLRDGLAWVDSGIIAGTTVYTPSGDIIVRSFLNGNTFGDRYVHYLGRDYLAVRSLDVDEYSGQVYLFDLLTGEYRIVDGYISTVSMTAPDNSLVLLNTTNDTRPDSVIDRDGRQLFIPPTQPPYAVDFTLSPDGYWFGYVSLGEGIVIGDRSGNLQPLDFDPSTIVWSAVQYTVVQPGQNPPVPVAPTEMFFTPQECGALPPVRLIAGGQGRVLPGTPNRIRLMPSPEAEQIGQIPPGEVFDLADGQQGVCAGGIRWAQVSYSGVTGWTAEGADGQAFLEAVE